MRLITLLNVDCKIASKAIAATAEKVLPLIINSNQAGFINGRYIGENIRLINDILKDQSSRHPGILLLLDFRKAFDKVEWGFLQNTQNLFNFGINIKQWVKTFYNNTAECCSPQRIRVYNNFFTITAEIHARSLIKFYCPYADRHMNLKFMRRVSERERAIRQLP